MLQGLKDKIAKELEGLLEEKLLTPFRGLFNTSIDSGCKLVAATVENAEAKINQSTVELLEKLRSGRVVEEPTVKPTKIYPETEAQISLPYHGP